MKIRMEVTRAELVALTYELYDRTSDQYPSDTLAYNLEQATAELHRVSAGVDPTVEVVVVERS